MKKSDAHAMVLEVLMQKELTKTVLSAIEAEAKEGRFNCSLTLTEEIVEMQKVNTLLLDLGYESSIAASYQGKVLNVRW